MDDDAISETLFAFQQEASDTNEDESEKDLIAVGSSNEEYLAIESFFRVKHAPLLKVKILPTKYHKPILVTALFDIGASQTIMNLEVLLKELWVPHKQYFKTVDN